MVFKRRSYGRRKKFGVRRPARRFGARVQRVVRNFAERKRVLMTWSDQEFDWDGHRKYLDEIAQGAGEDQRIGRMVTPHSFNARLELTNTEATQTDSHTWTAFLVQDLQVVGDAHATVTEIINGIGTPRAPMGIMNVNNKGRFKILRRWQGVLANTTSGSPIKYLNLYYKFRKPKKIRYNGALASDIEANSLMFVLVSGADPAYNSCYCNGFGRLWYTDV